MTGALGATLLLGALALAGARCTPASRPYLLPSTAGREATIADRLSFTLPLAFHETTGGSGRTFRERGTSDISYSTIHVESALVGAPLGLDDAFGQVVSRFTEAEGLDVYDLTLGFVGEQLTLSYAADFVWLDQPRRQWGTLIGAPDGLFALFMTAPKEHFAEAALDFYGAETSLQAL